MTPWIIITIISVLCSALFSGVEIAYITSDRVRVELDVKRGGFIARIINRFYSNSQFFISSILVGNNVMLVVYGMGAAYLLTPWLETLTDNEALILALQTIISTGIILLTGEFLPKTIFRINPNSSLKVFALPVYFFYLIFYPLSWFTTRLSQMLMRILGVREEDTRIRLMTIGDLNDYLEERIDDMAEKKAEVEHEVKIFQNALDFSSTHVADCMIPRNEIVAVDLDTATRQQLVELFTKTGRSKIIVYTGDIDTVVGYIHVSELFDPASDWRQKIKKVLYAPEPLLANKMMRRLLGEKRSVAIVIDEFGGTAGMVTLEDLVEEIFGDIRDEHDSAALTMRNVGPGIYEVSGRYEIEPLNEATSLNIPESDDYQTIAGYVLHATGTIPEEGTSVLLGHLRVDTIKKTAGRLDLLRVTSI